MALITKKPRGTEDVLPRDSYRWQFVEDIFRDEARTYGYKEMRTPVFEHTNLFERGVGDTTDVVQKEMYTFLTKGGDSITLRPEGTAGAARAFLEHGLHNDPLPVKVYYLTSCYRYEKPQAGRLREFGCPACRAEYHKALTEYFSQYKDELCEDCKGRLDRNPMRLLDCKVPRDHEIAQGAPSVLEYLCDECREHFDSVKEHLDAAGIEYIVNPTIVRGLDYYTKTVFEFISGDIGAQATICAGGRYDGLIEDLGGNPMPALGFAAGIERLLMTMDAQGVEIPSPAPCDIYVASMGDNAHKKAGELCLALRKAGMYAEFDVVGRGLKAQMKYANQLGARFSIVLGDDELAGGIGKLKAMDSGEQTDIPLDTESFVREFIAEKLKADFAEKNRLTHEGKLSP